MALYTPAAGCAIILTLLQCWSVPLVRRSAYCLYVYESQTGSYIRYQTSGWWIGFTRIGIVQLVGSLVGPKDVLPHIPLLGRIADRNYESARRGASPSQVFGLCIGVTRPSTALNPGPGTWCGGPCIINTMSSVRGCVISSVSNHHRRRRRLRSHLVSQTCCM